MVGDGMRTENDDVPIRFADSPPLGTEWVGFTSEDFKILAPSLQAHQGVKIVVHGDSLLSHVAMTMGIETDHEPRYRQVFRNLKMKSQMFWNAL